MIDPSLQPRTDWERRTLDRCRRYGLNVPRLNPGADAIRITGPGVRILAAALSEITKDDLIGAIDADDLEGVLR